MKRVYICSLLLSACSAPVPAPPAAKSPAPVRQLAQSAAAEYQQITPAMAAQVCLGQTLAQVEALLGRPGQVVSPPAIAGGPATYQWQNPDGAYLWVAFARNQVVGLGEVGLSGRGPLALNSACAGAEAGL